jgi:hypothetical protein
MTATASRIPCGPAVRSAAFGSGSFKKEEPLQEGGTAPQPRISTLISRAESAIVGAALHFAGAAQWRRRTSSPKPTVQGPRRGFGDAGRETGSRDRSRMPRGSFMNLPELDVTERSLKRFPNGPNRKDGFVSRGAGDRGAAAVPAIPAARPVVAGRALIVAKSSAGAVKHPAEACGSWRGR